ncbi:hypothetical protein ACFVZH_11940 [Streptomyces sp. NPDC059534]|uniref:hypothetical protein n=1 Tax=Streptomyces sp. NPDC059534 TaxID=3346859 RepID=UPI00369626EC
MSGPDSGRSTGRMLRVAVLVLVLEAAVTMAAQAVLAGSDAGPVRFLPVFTHPVLATVGVLGLLLAAVFLVLPTVWLSEELERRLGGRADAWIPAVAALAATVPVLPRALSELTGPMGAVGAWLTGLVVLTVAAAATRRAGRLPRLRGKAPAPGN